MPRTQLYLICFSWGTIVSRMVRLLNTPCIHFAFFTCETCELNSLSLAFLMGNLACLMHHPVRVGVVVLRKIGQPQNLTTLILLRWWKADGLMVSEIHVSGLNHREHKRSCGQLSLGPGASHWHQTHGGGDLSSRWARQVWIAGQNLAKKKPVATRWR